MGDLLSSFHGERSHRLVGPGAEAPGPVAGGDTGSSPSWTSWKKSSKAADIAIIQISSTSPLVEPWAVSVEDMSFAEVWLSAASPGGAGAGMACRGTLDAALGRLFWLWVSGGVVFLATP